MLRIISKEIVLITILGIIPVFVSYLSGGEELLDSVLKTLLAQRFALNYGYLLTGIFFAILLFRHFVYVRSDNTRVVLSWLNEVFEDVGTATLSAFRVGVGAIIGFPLLWLFFESESFNSSGLAFLGYGLIGLVDICALSFLHSYANRNWRRPTFNKSINYAH